MERDLPTPPAGTTRPTSLRPPGPSSGTPPTPLGQESDLLGEATTPAERGEGGVRAGGLDGGTPVGRVVPAGDHSSRRLIKAATFIMLGNLLSSLLGLVRLQVIAGLFGRSSEADAFYAALKIPQQFYDLLVGGAISGALIPTFVDYSAPDKRRELRRIFSSVLTLVALLTAVVVIALVLLAPLYMRVLVLFQGSTFDLTVNLTRLVVPSIFLLGLFAVGSALLYALRSVIFASWANPLYHVGIILGAAIGALLLGLHYGIYGAGIGVLFGAAGEVTLIAIGLARSSVRYRPALDLKHPAVRQILRLYAPVALGLVVTVLGQQIDLHLASGLSKGSVSALAYATTLIGFPTGLVAAALSFAILPSLTAHATDGNMQEFKRTLRLGIKLGLLLMIPATVGLDVLREPIIALLLLHGHFTLNDVHVTALALLNYSYQLPFLVLDQLLIAAFYARKNTLTPVIIGAVGWLFYLAVALPLVGSIGMPALAFAQAFQNSAHAIILLILLRRAIGPLAGEGLLAALGKICLASAIMGGACWALLQVVSPLTLFNLQHLGGQALTVLVTAGGGTLIYFLLAHLFGLQEVRLLGSIVRRRLGRTGESRDQL
jgi:putative peptidoglycan lipid II flippase